MSTITSMYQILKAIDLSYENNDFDFDKTFDLNKLKISERRLILLLKNLINDGYIDGLSITGSYEGKFSVSDSTPRLTTAGLIFLEENSAMKKAYNTLKEARAWIPGFN